MPSISLDDFVAVATIKCSHASTRKTEFHRIGVRVDGRLIFFDHPSMMTEIELFRLAAASDDKLPHTCAEIIAQWAKEASYYLPKSLQAARDMLDEIRAERIRARRNNRCREHRSKGFDAACPGCTRDSLQRSFRRRWEIRTKRAAKGVMEQVTRFKKATHHTVIVRVHEGKCDKCRNRVATPVTNEETGALESPCCKEPLIREAWVEGTSEREWDKHAEKYKRNSAIEVNVTLAWYARVFRHGLGVVDGYFVLDAEPCHDFRGEQFRLRVARPSRGYTTTTQLALYRPGEGKLQWL